MRRHLTFFVAVAFATFFVACEGMNVPDGPDGSDAGILDADAEANPGIVVSPEVEAQYGADYKFFGAGAVAKAGEVELTTGAPVVRSIGKDETDQFHFYTGVWKRYDVVVRPAAGDVDLYTHAGEEISEDDYTCSPGIEGNGQENCSTFGATSGEYYAMIKGVEASVYAILLVETSTDCHVGDVGDQPYCTETCPCGLGQGDCASDAECATGLSCTVDGGDEFGLDPDVDVCTY